MNLFRFLFLALFILPLSPGPIKPAETVAPEIFAGLVDAQVGLCPLTGAPSGWYTSDVTIHILAPIDALADGKPIPGGKLTITSEGHHEIKLQPNPLSQANLVTQIVDIDKTPPRVTWLTGPNVAIVAGSTLNAEISDATSGICSIEASLDFGQTWERQFAAAPGFPEAQVLHETNWSLRWDSARMAGEMQLIQLRAHDCAGNVSPGEILVVRVQK